MCLEPPPKNIKKMKTGHTTGACATACSKAAMLSLLKQKKINDAEIILPAGKIAKFRIKDCKFSKNSATATTVKDAGDDPDVTHGAVIGAKISLNKIGGIKFFAGKGVGTATLPGLGINVGEAAINPVPRKMMSGVVKEILKQNGREKQGANITVFVRDGEKIAKKTLNSRLGIKGGISIIGTSGIVRPFSSASYVASIFQAVAIAAKNGQSHIIASSGGRSEKLLKKKFPELPDHAFVQYGNWIGKLLSAARKNKIKKLTLAAMIGKAVKLAAGEMDTHSGKSKWNKEVIAKMAKKSGEKIGAEAIKKLNIAGRITEIFPLNQSELFYNELLKRCHKNCSEHFGGELRLALVGADGQIVWYPKISKSNVEKR